MRNCHKGEYLLCLFLSIGISKYYFEILISCAIMTIMNKLLSSVLMFLFFIFSLPAESVETVSLAFGGFGGGLPSSAITMAENENIQKLSEEEEESHSGVKTAVLISVGVVATVAVVAVVAVAAYYGYKAGSDCMDKCLNDCSDDCSKSCGDSMAESCNNQTDTNTCSTSKSVLSGASILPVYMP